MGIEIRKFADGDIGKVLELCRFARDFHIKMLDGYFCPQDDEQEQKKYMHRLITTGFWRMLRLLKMKLLV